MGPLHTMDFASYVQRRPFNAVRRLFVVVRNASDFRKSLNPRPNHGHNYVDALIRLSLLAMAPCLIGVLVSKLPQARSTEPISAYAIWRGANARQCSTCHLAGAGIQ